MEMVFSFYLCFTSPSSMEVSMINQTRLPTIRDFLKLPNPRIFALFVTSSTATFSLGVAMAVYWGLYGRRHPGFYWLVYYAPVLITLPVLICVIFLVIAAFLHSLPPLSDPSSESKAQYSGDQKMDEVDEVEEVILDEEEECDVEEIQIGIHENGDHPLRKTETQILKRTLSVPRARLPANQSKFKRCSSFH